MPDRPPSGGSSDDYSWLYGPSSDKSPDRTQDDVDPDRTHAVDPDRTQAIPAGAPTAADRTQRVATGPAARQPQDSSLPPMQLPPPGMSRAGVPVGLPRTAGGSTRTPGRAKKVRWGRIVAALLALWLLFLIAVPVYAWSRIDRVDAEPDGDRPADQGGTTYLLVGSDSREDLDEEQRQELFTGEGIAGSRTDTILLLHVGDGQPLLLSIPRDSPVDIPGHGSGKINSAYNSDAYEDGGPELLVETIEANTGIRVDDYVEVGFGGFVNVVDALGGIEICPKEAIKDPLAGLDLAKGCQEADGVTALGFARTRKSFAMQDLARVQNQRAVISSIGSEAASPSTVLNPWRYWQVSSSGASSVTIGDNVGPISMARFAWTMSRIQRNGLSCTVPVRTTTSTLEWDPELAPAMFEAVANDSTDDITKDMCRSKL
jgi:LCP family protein required for cell wall assembly